MNTKGKHYFAIQWASPYGLFYWCCGNYGWSSDLNDPYATVFIFETRDAANSEISTALRSRPGATRVVSVIRNDQGRWALKPQAKPTKRKWWKFWTKT